MKLKLNPGTLPTKATVCKFDVILTVHRR